MLNIYGKTIKIILLTVLLSLFLYFCLPLENISDSAMQENQIGTTISITQTPTPKIATPKRLIIAKLEINSLIESVTNNSNGIMNLPDDPFKVGWYESGYKPGEKGNAVIGGHLDLSTGEPAIFFRLKELEKGDTISVVDEENITRDFIVVNTQTYDYEEIPNEIIFGESDSYYLNLITCSGWFNNLTKNYSHRLVINSELSESKKTDYNN